LYGVEIIVPILGDINQKRKLRRITEVEGDLMEK
jgi:hypothetical protein